MARDEPPVPESPGPPPGATTAPAPTTPDLPAPGPDVRGDYTEGSVLGSILRMGLPSMFGFLVQHVYTLVDMWWVSRLPEAEAGVAAITFVGNVLWVLFSFNQLVGPGSVAIISRRYGERRWDETEGAIKEALLLKLVFGAVFAAAGILLVGRLLTGLGAVGETHALGVEYGRIYLLGLPVMYATYTIFTAMRGVANPKMSFVLMLGANVLNMVLDPVLMFGWLGLPALGIRGAAIASVVSFVAVFAVGLGLFFRGRTNVRLRLRGSGSISVASMGRMIRIGVPAWIGDLSFSGARMLITALVAPYGTAVVAAYGVGTQVTAFGIMAVVGIGLGLSALIGHNVGAGKKDRAVRTGDVGAWLGGGMLAAYGIVVALAAGPVARLFFSDPAAITAAVPMLRIFAIGFPFIGAFIMMAQVFGGVGKNQPTMYFNLVHSWVLEVGPIGWMTAGLGYPPEAVWWALTVAEILNCLAFAGYYRRRTWLDHRV
jgi:putative MATE family efflux protein